MYKLNRAYGGESQSSLQKIKRTLKKELCKKMKEINNCYTEEELERIKKEVMVAFDES